MVEPLRFCQDTIRRHFYSQGTIKSHTKELINVLWVRQTNFKIAFIEFILIKLLDTVIKRQPDLIAKPLCQTPQLPEIRRRKSASQQEEIIAPINLKLFLGHWHYTLKSSI